MLGIGSGNPGTRLRVAGDLKVTGAYRVDIRSALPSDGAPFSRPAYDSDWQYLDRGTGLTLTHDADCDVDGHVVDILTKNTAVHGITNINWGGETYYASGVLHSQGLRYSNANTSSVQLARGPFFHRPEADGFAVPKKMLLLK